MFSMGQRKPEMASSYVTEYHYVNHCHYNDSGFVGAEKVKFVICILVLSLSSKRNFDRGVPNDKNT